VSRHLAVAIEVRRFGQQLFYSALDGAAPDNAEWIRRKGNTRSTFLSQLLRHRARFKAEKQQFKRPLRPINVGLRCGRRVLSADRGSGRSYWAVNRIWPASP
jgi:Haem-degrading